MTCSKNFGRLLQVSSLGLIGMLAVVGCGGSENNGNRDSGVNGEVGPGLTGAALNLDKLIVNLGALEVNQTGVGTVTVTNVGKGTSGAVVVTPSAGVTAVGCTGQMLAANQPCTITISATPTVAGSFSGTVTISATPGAATPLQVSVIAQVGKEGVFSVSPGAIDLGNVAVGVPAPKQTITVTAAVAIADLLVVASGSDISIDKTLSTCATALAAGAPCSVVVNFTAVAAGPRSNSVSISGGGASGKVVSVPITATAQNPAKLVITPSGTQSFVANVGKPSSAIPFGVANAGDVATGSIAVTVTGPNAADFTATSACLVLAPLSGCTVTVVFTPAALSATAETATLTVADTGAGASVVSVQLSGTALPVSQLTITPATSDLGSVLVGTTGPATTFTVTNMGSTPSGVLGVAVSSTDFLVTNDTCTGTSLVALTGACTISIALRPATIGAKTAILTVSNAGGDPAAKNLTGTGISSPMLSAAPSALDFGSVRVNKMGTAQVVTVKNNGGSNTGALSFTKSGDFADFPITANTCSAALGPAATCTFTVNFAPTKVASETASYTVTDGTTSATVAVSGNGLAATGITISPTLVTATSDPNFPETVIGGSSESVTFVVTADDTLPAGLVDTGALTVALGGTNAGDFTILTNGCTVALLPSAQCQIEVSFSPTAVGDLQATLGVTTANGGSASATMQSKGLALLEIRPDDATTDGKTTGLSFGQVPLLADEVTSHDFTVIVRGPNSATAHTSSVVVNLTDPLQPADFSYRDLLHDTGYDSNPCNTTSNTAVLLDFSDGSITGSTNAEWDWSGSEFSCQFTVYFYPQSSKGDKTAELAATGSGGGADKKTLTGTATGILTFNPTENDFGSDWMVGESSNTQTITTIVTISGAEDITVTLRNHSQTDDVGPVSLTLAGANGSEFKIVADRCSTITLGHIGSVPYPNTCTVTVAFVPASVGAKTATLTANAGTETADVTFTAGVGQSFDITIAPDQCTTAACPDHDMGTVPQTGAGAWVAFTVTNPAGSPRSAQVGYYLDDGEDFVLADGNNHVRGTCGQSGSTALQPGDHCTIFVQFKPSTGSTATGTGNGLTDILYARDEAKGNDSISVNLVGKVTSALTITPASHDFGDVAENTPSAGFTFTLTNAGTVSATLDIPDGAPPFTVDQNTGCTLLSSLAPSTSCDLVVKFIGEDGIDGPVDPVDLVITNTNTDAPGTVTAQLTGTTVKPAKLVAVGWDNAQTTWPYNLDLGAVVMGQQSGIVTLTFQNTGSKATSAIHYAWSGLANDTADNELIIMAEGAESCIGKALAPQATCTVRVYFEPSVGALDGARARKNFTLSATTGGSVRLFSFDSVAVDPAAKSWTGISGGANAFYTFPGMTPVGVAVQNAPTQTFQITNGTGDDVTLGLAIMTSYAGAAAASPDFSIVATTTSPCGSTLAAASSCTFAVRFLPVANVATTIYRQAYVVVDGDQALGLIAHVQSPAALEITPKAPTSFEFGQVVIGAATPSSKTFTVTNTGETATSEAVTMAPIADNTHVVVTSTCAAALPAGGTCTGTVTINPTSPLAAYGGTLQAVSTGMAPSNALTISATGVIDTLLSLSIPTMTFQPQAVGTESAEMTVTISNAAGARTSGVFTLALADDTNFTIVSSTCDLATAENAASLSGLAGGASCTVTLRFQPQTLGTGTFPTTLKFTAAHGNTPTLNITGTAVSALTIDRSSPQVVNTGNSSISDPFPVTVMLADGAATTSYINTSISTANYMIVEDQCVANKLRGGQSCQIWVAYIGGADTPLKTGTLTVNGGMTDGGNTATLVMNSTAAP